MARKAKYVEGKDFNLLLPFKVKGMGMDEENTEVIKIEGYANYSGDIDVADSCCFIDRTNDVVVPAGMDISNYKKNPVILLNHDRDYPIGKGIDIQKRADGIYVVAEIHAGAMDDEDFYTIKNGLISSFSIGFRTKAGEFRTINDTDVYFITKAELHEISVVTIPCNTESGFSIIKSFGTDGFRGQIPTQPKVVEEKSYCGDETMKLKRSELLPADVVEQYKSLGLHAELEGEVEVSTKSFIEQTIAKHFADLETKLLSAIEEKFKSEEVPAETPAETPAEEEKPASNEEVPAGTEEGKSDEGAVEEKYEEADAIKALSATIAETLKAFA